MKSEKAEHERREKERGDRNMKIVVVGGAVLILTWLALSFWSQWQDPAGYEARQMERARERMDWQASGPYR